MPTLQQISDSVVLVRVAFDLPSLNDRARIKDALPTIKLLLQNNNKVVLVTKWGRPKGQDQEFSTQKMANGVETLVRSSILTELSKQGRAGHSGNLKIDQEWEHNYLYITFVDQFKGFELAKDKIQNFRKQDSLLPGEGRLFILENTHFDDREKSKDVAQRLEIAQEYASLANYFVDEAFPSSHRREATNTEIKELLPWTLGLAYQKEIQNLEKLKYHSKKPFVVIMAGAKLETKLPLIGKIIEKADQILLGGMLSFTFLQAAKDLGLSDLPLIYDSLVELEFLEQAKELLLKYPQKLILPIDLVYEKEGDKTYARDVGSQTVELFTKALKQAKTVFWNGTLGFYEKKPFDTATLQLGQVIAHLDQAFTVLGGGDTGASLPQEILDQIDFVSMGGGATLEYLSR